MKLRGYRIEPGEIEAVLLAQDSVQDAVVIDIDGPSGKQLVAYLVASDPARDTHTLREELKSLLKQGLPEYMVPSHFIWLAQLPLTPNGKIGRAHV